MATIRQRASGSWEIIIRRKVLPRAHCATADTEAEAVAYARRIEAALDQGVLPAEVMDCTAAAKSVGDWARLYLVQVAVSAADYAILNRMLETLSAWPVNDVTMDWARRWVSGMKQVDKLSPSTIRHKVGAVARLLDWCVANVWLTVNPLRMLPKRYASYTPADGEQRRDIERDRRLLPGEFERIMWVLDGNKADDKQRGIVMADRLAWKLLFVLAIESAMRLREMYSLEISQVDMDQRTVFLEKTKNGDKRQVPLTSVAIAALQDHFEHSRGMVGLVFPWWDGDDKSLQKTTNRLSRKWGTIARLAGCDDLHFHDLRHEATSRLYERTTLSDVRISKITGHKDLRMLKRYCNLRGSDLADLLW